MKKPNNISFLNFLLSLSSLSFLVLYFILSYYNRFAADDYHYISQIKNNGIIGSMQFDYFNWGGRWATNLVWSIVFCNYNHPFVLIAYTFFNIILLAFSLYFLLKKIFSLINFKPFSNYILFNCCMLFVQFVFFISPGKGEAWFWTVSNFTYLLSVTFFLLGSALIISKKNNFFFYPLIALCFVYTGGASEAFAMSYIFIILFFLLLIWKFHLLDFTTSKKSITLKACVALVFLLASWKISVACPGNKLRAAMLPETSFINTFYITFKSLAKLILFKLSPQVLWFLLFTAPWLFIGYLNGNEQNKSGFKNYIKKFILSAVILILIFYLLLFPACYTLSEIGPDRSLLQIVFFTAAFFAGWAYFIGYKCLKGLIFPKYLFIISIITIIISVSTISIMQYNIVSKYAAALDERTNYLLKLQENKNKNTVELKPLTSSGYLYSAEISSDTNYFVNQHYKNGLFLDFNVKIESGK